MLAAFCVVTVEIVRLIFLETSDQLDVGQWLGICFAIAGLVGLPLTVVGTLMCAAVTAVRKAWSSDHKSPFTPASAWGWCLYFLLGCTALGVGVHFAVFYASRHFKKAVYVGLGGALAAIVIVTILVAISLPIARLLTRGVEAGTRQLPSWLDPTKRMGLTLWLMALAFLGAFIVPALIKPLDTVDLRPLRYVALWCTLLVAFATLLPRRKLLKRALLGVCMSAIFLSGLIWSAHRLSGDQNRLLTISRDTVLAGPLMRQFSKFGDGDGDGVSRWFITGDCDDTNPKIRPGVYDIPDDGIDQNCVGGDLKLSEPVVSKPQRKKGAKRQDWHVVLLTVDALRNDTMRAHMPKLKALAANAIDFENAYSHGAATYWSLAALMTSKLPSRLRLGRDQTPVAGELLLTEVLRNQGWHTALFANVTVFFIRGLRQGTYVSNYDTSAYTVHGAKPGSAHLTDGLLKHVDSWQAGKLLPKRNKFSIWAHYYDPHDPYFSVPGYPAADGSDKSKYEAIARYVDDEIARLVDGLKKRGLWEKTLFVLTADHGDEFLDHGHRFHGSTLYDEMTHVPLIMHVPGASNRRVSKPIGQVELAPTMLELLGVDIPRKFEGRSRAEEVMTGKPAPHEPVFLEVFPDSNYSSHQAALRDNNLKLIYRLADNFFEMYDLANDPKERVNVIDEHPESARLKHLLGRYVDRQLFSLAHGKSGAKRPAGSPPKRKAKARKKKPRRKRSPKSVKPGIKRLKKIGTKIKATTGATTSKGAPPGVRTPKPVGMKHLKKSPMKIQAPQKKAAQQMRTLSSPTKAGKTAR